MVELATFHGRRGHAWAETGQARVDGDGQGQEWAADGEWELLVGTRLSVRERLLLFMFTLSRPPLSAADIYGPPLACDQTALVAASVRCPRCPLPVARQLTFLLAWVLPGLSSDRHAHLHHHVWTNARACPCKTALSSILRLAGRWQCWFDAQWPRESGRPPAAHSTCPPAMPALLCPSILQAGSDQARRSTLDAPSSSCHSSFRHYRFSAKKQGQGCPSRPVCWWLALNSPNRRIEMAHSTRAGCPREAMIQSGKARRRWTVFYRSAVSRASSRAG
jgi:hypothetical protein